MMPLALFVLACADFYLCTLDAAFALAMRLSLRLVADRAGRGARLGRYLDDPVLLVLPLRLLIGAVTAAVTVLITVMVGTAHPHSIALVIALLASFLLVCVVVIPVLVARHDPERLVEALLPAVNVVVRLLEPLTLAMVRGASVRRDRAAHQALGLEAVEDVGDAPGAPADNGVTDAMREGEERRLLQSIVEFGGTLVREVMTPRPDIVAVPSTATLAELRGVLRDQGYSRIPVYKDGLDNILGFVFVKDVIQMAEAEMASATVTSLMRPAYFVPETKKVADLLRDFQREQVQIAIVVDEYGGTAGLVTIEDLLEEIVGEIRDEYDRETELIIEETPGTFLVSGKAGIDEVARRLGLSIERKGFDTVGGFVLARVGHVPAVGESFEADGMHVEVVDAERRRVHKLRIRVAPPAEATAESPSPVQREP